MDQTWVPSMPPPLLRSNLKVFGRGIWHFALTRKNKNWEFEGEKDGAEALHNNFKNIQCYIGFPNSRHSS